MADAAEEVAGLPVGAVRLKWPNDLVIEIGGTARAARRRADARGGSRAARGARRAAQARRRPRRERRAWARDDPRVVVGIGINGDWAAADFPPELAGADDEPARGLRRAARSTRTRCSTRSSSGSRCRIEALREGVFDVGGLDRAPGDDRPERDPRGDGGRRPRRRARRRRDDAAPSSSRIAAAPGGERHVHAGEVTRVRLAAARV